MQRALIGLLVASQLGACAATTYAPYDQKDAAQPLFERRVYAHVAPELASRPLRCVMVTPGERDGDGALMAAVAASLRRQLADHFERVIAAEESARAAGRWAYDTDSDPDLRRMAERLDCDSALRWRVLDGAERFALVWADRRVGLEVELLRAGDGLVLWQASHVGVRWAGGAPLSWLALPVAVAQAAQLHQDRDGIASLVDDVVRRVTATLSVLPSRSP
jgi:hypothetical protein